MASRYHGRTGDRKFSSTQNQHSFLSSEWVPPGPRSLPLRRHVKSFGTYVLPSTYIIEPKLSMGWAGIYSGERVYGTETVSGGLFRDYGWMASPQLEPEEASHM